AFVECRPLLATLPEILGDQKNHLGGATFESSPFRPGIPDKGALHPPCEFKGRPTFVEVHRVEIGWVRHQRDGDLTFHLTDPSRSDLTEKVRSIHAEISGEWIEEGKAPSLDLPAEGTLIDLQGFVFW